MGMQSWSRSPAGENRTAGFWEGAKSPWRFIQLCTERPYAEDNQSQQQPTPPDGSGYGHVACLLRSGWLVPPPMSPAMSTLISTPWWPAGRGVHECRGADPSAADA